VGVFCAYSLSLVGESTYVRVEERGVLEMMLVDKVCDRCIHFLANGIF